MRYIWAIVAGAFIPRIKTIQNTLQYSLATFDLHFYFDAKTINSSGKLYNDNGTTPNAFEKGAYELLHFDSNVNKKQLTLKLSNEVGKNFLATDKSVSLLIHNLKSKILKVTVNGKNVPFKINKSNLEIPISWKKETPQEIKIQF